MQSKTKIIAAQASLEQWKNHPIRAADRNTKSFGVATKVAPRSNSGLRLRPLPYSKPVIHQRQQGGSFIVQSQAYDVQGNGESKMKVTGLQLPPPSIMNSRRHRSQNIKDQNFNLRRQSMERIESKPIVVQLSARDSIIHQQRSESTAMMCIQSVKPQFKIATSKSFVRMLPPPQPQRLHRVQASVCLHQVTDSKEPQKESTQSSKQSTSVSRNSNVLLSRRVPFLKKFKILGSSEKKVKPPLEESPPKEEPGKKVKRATITYDQLYILNFRVEDCSPAKLDEPVVEFVNPLNRTKMVDWALQVFSAFQRSTSKTFFNFTYLLDRYLQKVEQPDISLDELHLIGLTCIFIASKNEDVCPIHLGSVIRDAAHNSITQDELLEAETKILRTLSFKVNLPTETPVEHGYSLLLDYCLHPPLNFITPNRDMSSVPVQLRNEIFSTLQFICIAMQHRLQYSMLPNDVQARMALMTALSLVNEQSDGVQGILNHFTATLPSGSYQKDLFKFIDQIRHPSNVSIGDIPLIKTLPSLYPKLVSSKTE